MWLKFRRKPGVVIAKQWFRKGDIPEVVEPYIDDFIDDDDRFCEHCGTPISKHGRINAFVSKYEHVFEGERIVCPGDWIVKNEKGEYYLMKPDIFSEIYEEVDKE